MRLCAAGNRVLFWVTVGLGFGGIACGRAERSCIDTRSCIAPIGFIDAGNVDDWWNGGASGDDAPAGEAATSSENAGGARGDGGSRGAADDTRESAAGALGEEPAGASLTSAIPQVVAVSPSNHAIGVARDAPLRITFDRPMNEAAVLAAYTSDDLPIAGLAASWNAAGTALTLNPKAALGYASGSVPIGETPNFPARTYHFSFDERALDQSGGALEPVSYSFSTLRAVSSELGADAARTGNWTEGEDEGLHNCLRHPSRGYVPTVCIGDDASNVRYTGFISFDLSVLPANVQAIASARLVAGGTVNGTLAQLGPTSLEHVSFGELDAAALTAPASASFGSFLSAAAVTAGSRVELSLDVTAAVSADYAQADTPCLSQYRLAFADVSANGIWDDLELQTSTVSLALSYLVP